MTFLIINGAMGGRTGNTSMLLKKIAKIIKRKYSDSTVKIIHLHPTFSWPNVKKQIHHADCLILGTGTYWDSWGSPMQQFFEKMTILEGSTYLRGKPAAAIVTMHSVGGKEVASRMLGNLINLGCTIPPFAGFAYSYSDHIAHKAKVPGKKIMDDVWNIEDIDTIIDNLHVAATINKNNNNQEDTPKYKVWDFLDTKAFDPTTVWLK